MGAPTSSTDSSLTLACRRFALARRALHDDAVRSLVSLFGSILVVVALSTNCSSSARSCTSNSDCATAERCLYPIGTCEAQGECKSAPPGIQCGAIMMLCGCNGSVALSGCGYPDNFASAPTTGAGANASAPGCGDAGAADSGAADASGG
jgi:hypothetical protein